MRKTVTLEDLLKNYSPNNQRKQIENQKEMFKKIPQNYGSVNSIGCSYSHTVRPAFTMSLSKLEYEFTGERN